MLHGHHVLTVFTKVARRCGEEYAVENIWFNFNSSTGLEGVLVVQQEEWSRVRYRSMMAISRRFAVDDGQLELCCWLIIMIR